MRVLVTGGAGYIGSHAVRCLAEAGHHVAVVDNLFRGHREAVPETVAFHELDTRSTDALRAVLQTEQIDCVMHFAALAYVGESVDLPLFYYDNNVGGTLSLLEAVRDSGVHRFVFSSTCATYGEPDRIPISEDERQWPVNPYGWSKLVAERMLHDHAQIEPEFAFAALRYFNVAGSASDGSLGEDHRPETHLIPLALQAALGKRKLTVFGDDYPTPDGTCIRDYVHVEDLIDAHVHVMEHLKAGDRRAYNLGIGRGYSVREVIDTARRVTGQDFPVEMGPRRAGDPPELVASPGKITRELGWRAKRTDLGEIIETAWRWFRDHPDGY